VDYLDFKADQVMVTLGWRPQQLLFGIEVADKTVHATREALTVAAAMRL